MSEGSLKPLVFLHPLSPTLEKLREIMSENSEDEGIEIYDVETPEEGVQLIPAIGQSLIMCNSPKACAMLLQPVRKVVKKLETKTILVSTKAIPAKTLEKFMKIGLTECVVEPVNPKTLLYKVRLQLRSISTKKEASDMEFKESQKTNEKESEEANNKNKSSKQSDDELSVKKNNEGITDDKNDKDDISHLDKVNDSEDLYARKKKKREIKNNEDDDELYSLKKNNKNDKDENELDYFDKNESSEEDDDGILEKRRSDHINGHYEGENNEDQNVDDKSKNKSNFKEEALGGHYQGQVSNTSNENDKPEKPASDDEIDTEALKESIEKSAKSELAKDTEKSQELKNIEEDDAKKRKAKQEQQAEKELRKSNFKEDELGGNYKGSIESKEDKQAPKKEKNEDIKSELEDDIQKGLEDSLQDEDIDDLLNEEGPIDEALTDEKKRTALQDDLGGNLEGQINNQNKETDHEKEDNKNEEILEETQDKSSKINNDENDKEKKNHKNVSDQIDGNINGASSTDQLKDDITSGEGSKADNIDGHLRGGAAKKDLDESEEEKNRSSEIKLEDNDTSHKDPEIDEALEETKEKPVTLDFLNEEKPIEKEDNEDEIEEDEETGNNLDLEFTDADIEKTNKEEDSDSKDPNRTNAKSDELDKDWGGTGSTDQSEDKNNKSNAKSDVISTHYSNKTSTTHNDDDYGKDWKANKQEKEERERKERKKVTPLDEVTPDGETIDYAKIKEEFDAFEYGSEQKEKVPYSFESEVADVETTEKTVLGSDGQLVTMSFEDVEDISKRMDDEYDELLIFEPRPQGIQHIIKILKLYQDVEYSHDSIYKNVCFQASESYQCDVIFYLSDKQSNKHICQYNGYINNRISKPDESSFDDIDDFNESHNHYEQNLTIYQQDWNDIEKEHIEYWSMCKSPTWSDPTFQIEENIFIFPYFEGQNQLGFAVVKPELVINEDQSSSIEILLESVRGVFLNKRPSKVDKNEKQKSNKSKEPKKGLFGRIFNKIAG